MFQVYILFPLYQKFIGGLCICLRRWIETIQEIPEGDTSYWIPAPTQEDDIREEKKAAESMGPDACAGVAIGEVNGISFSELQAQTDLYTELFKNVVTREIDHYRQLSQKPSKLKNKKSKFDSFTPSTGGVFVSATPSADDDMLSRVLRDAFLHSPDLGNAKIGSNAGRDNTSSRTFAACSVARMEAMKRSEIVAEDVDPKCVVSQRMNGFEESGMPDLKIKDITEVIECRDGNVDVESLEISIRPMWINASAVSSDVHSIIVNIAPTC